MIRYGRWEHSCRAWPAALALLVHACSSDKPGGPQPEAPWAAASSDPADPVPETSPAAMITLNIERCGRFTLHDVEELCRELEGDCDGECGSLRAKIGANPFRTETSRGQVIMFCGQHYLQWYRAETLVVDGCFPRPTCYTAKVARNDDTNALGTEIGWEVLLTTWMDDTGICERRPESGVPVTYEHYRLNADDTVSYVGRGSHGSRSLRPIHPVALAEYFTALGVMVNGSQPKP